MFAPSIPFLLFSKSCGSPSGNLAATRCCETQTRLLGVRAVWPLTCIPNAFLLQSRMNYQAKYWLLKKHFRNFKDGVISIASCGILKTDTVVLYHVLSFAWHWALSLGAALVTCRMGQEGFPEEQTVCLKSHLFSFSQFCDAMGPYSPCTLFCHWRWAFSFLSMFKFLLEYLP